MAALRLAVRLACGLYWSKTALACLLNRLSRLSIRNLRVVFRYEWTVLLDPLRHRVPPRVARCSHRRAAACPICPHRRNESSTAGSRPKPSGCRGRSWALPSSGKTAVFRMTPVPRTAPRKKPRGGEWRSLPVFCGIFGRQGCRALRRAPLACARRSASNGPLTLQPSSGGPWPLWGCFPPPPVKPTAKKIPHLAVE